MKLAHRIALVTGAGSGIGQATASLFAEQGATVVVADIHEAAAQATVRDLGSDAHVAIACDVADPDAVAAMFADTRSRFGRLDVLVCCAGVSEGAPGENDRMNANAKAVMADVMSPGERTTHWDITPHVTDESWARMLAVHLSGTFYCDRAAIPLMIEAGQGSIVNTSSAGALLGQAGIPHYSAAKAGILGLTRALAGELGSRNIRVNAIAPGAIETPMTAVIEPALRMMMLATAPLARVADPREVATTALFLASDDSSFFTGQTLEPNGGIHM